MTAPTTLPDLPAERKLSSPPPGRGRRIVLYAAARGTTEGMRSLRGLLLAIVLGPRAFGIWTLFRIFMRYTPLSGLGVQRGLELEIVQERALGDAEAIGRSTRSARTALGWILVTAIATSLAALIASFVVTDEAWKLALRAVALGVVLEELWVFATTYLRALRELRRYALLEIANASLHLIAAVGMAMLFGLRGAIAGFVIGALVSLWTVRKCAPFSPALSKAALRRLLDIGVPLALSTALTVALGTADRLVVAAYGGPTALGVYAFGVSIAGLAASLAWIIRTVIFPDVYGSARVAGAATAMREHLDRTVLPFAYLFPPILGVLALAMEPAMSLALPRYLPAAAAARIFIFAAAAGGITTLGAIGVVATGRQRALPMLSALALCINLACSMLALEFGGGLALVAGGAVLAQATIATGVLAILGRQATESRAAMLVVKGLLPLAWCIANVALAFVDPGQGALVPDPSYPVYKYGTIMADGVPLSLPLREENGWLPDLDALDSSVMRDVNVLWLNYPNNPTGATADLDFFERAVHWAKRHDIIIAHDNPYSEITFDGYRPPSILQVAGAKDVAVEFNSLSKTYSMAGDRIGMVVGNADIVGVLGRIKSNIDSGIYGAIQDTAILALTGDQSWIPTRNDIYCRRRDVVCDTLASIGIEAARPKAGLYVWAKTPRGFTSKAFADNLLDVTGIAVTAGSSYGAQGEGYFRMSLTVPDEQVAAAMEKLSHFNINAVVGSR